MNKVIEILMKRDGITYDEAMQLVKDAVMQCKSLIMKGYSLDDVWEEWTSETGLEPDYLDDLLY